MSQTEDGGREHNGVALTERKQVTAEKLAEKDLLEDGCQDSDKNEIDVPGRTDGRGLNGIFEGATECKIQRENEILRQVVADRHDGKGCAQSTEPVLATHRRVERLDGGEGLEQVQKNRESGKIERNDRKQILNDGSVIQRGGNACHECSEQKLNGDVDDDQRGRSKADTRKIAARIILGERACDRVKRKTDFFYGLKKKLLQNFHKSSVYESSCRALECSRAVAGVRF